METVTLKKDDLRELIAECNRSEYNTTSNLMGDVFKKLDRLSDKVDAISSSQNGMDKKVDIHTVQLDSQGKSLSDVNQSVKDLSKSLVEVKEKQDNYEGGKAASITIMSIVIVLVGSLISVIWINTNDRINKVEAKIYDSKL